MKKVHYIGWYIAKEDEGLYTGNVPGALKMRYVNQMLLQTGYQVSILSLADKKCKVFSSSETKSNDGGNLKYVANLICSNKLLKKINSWLRQIQFTLYILFNVKKEETIVLYHSVEYTKIMANLKKFIRRNVIIEVEEVYGYSAVEDKPWVNAEIEAIKKMDYFILVNDGMKKTLALPEYKCVVSYGVGFIPERTADRFDDGKIHVIYAGTIEAKKRGAFTAVETAEFLPENYLLHIIGFGNDTNMSLLKEKIINVNEKAGYEKVRYDGYYSGEELDKFLFRCHIGLSSNVMRPNFANHSFPSKVITYMCHDLSVVLGYAEAFYKVELSTGWTFYKEFTPEQIANAIIGAEVKPVGAYHEQIINMNNQLVSFFNKFC